jgi:zinc protease
LKQQNYAAIEQQKSEPDAVAVNAFSRHASPYPKGDVRYVETPEEALESYKAATLDDAKKFHGDYYGASVGEVALVGDFDAKEAVDTLTRLFGDWKSPRAYERVAQPYQAVAPFHETLQTPDKANAFYISGQNLPIRDDDPDYPALVLGDYMLGGGFLNSRFATRIRQKEGLSYGVGSQLSASAIDKSGSFVSYAIYAPQNGAKLESAMREELERARKDGFTEEEIAEAKKGYFQGEAVARAQDATLAQTLAADLFLGRTLRWDEDFEKRVAALKSDEISAAMRKHLDPAQFSVVQAGDFAKAAGASAK